MLESLYNFYENAHKILLVDLIVGGRRSWFGGVHMLRSGWKDYCGILNPQKRYNFIMQNKKCLDL